MKKGNFIEILPLFFNGFKQLESFYFLFSFALIEMSYNFQEKTVVEDEDPVTLMLQKTGCINLHYKVQVIERNFAIFTSHFHYNSFLFSGVHERNRRLEKVSRSRKGV